MTVQSGGEFLELGGEHGLQVEYSRKGDGRDFQSID